MKIKKGDNVKMLNGKDRSKTGKVLRVDQHAHTVVVEGLNLMKRHLRPRREGQQGQIISKERSVSAASVAVVCKACGKASRIGHRLQGDVKSRVCKRCGAEV